MGKHLLDQIKSKVLFIAKTLYLGYELLFMFDNTISHAIYIKDELLFAHIKESSVYNKLALWNAQHDQMRYLVQGHVRTTEEFQKGV